VGGDGCVDLNDAIDVVRNWGRPVTTKYDLNLDGTVGFLDFLAAMAAIDGTCGLRDQTTPVAPVRCTHGSVVLQNKSITTAETAIDVRGSCNITIKNSRIVAGKEAIRVRGSATVTIENSTVAGEKTFLILTGATRVRAKNSLFRGARDITGALVIEDLGGNDWPQP